MQNSLFTEIKPTEITVNSTARDETDHAQAKAMTKQKFDAAVDSMVSEVFAKGLTPAVMSSMGKDSTVIMMITVAALRKAMTMPMPVKPEMHVFSSYTGGIESPIIADGMEKQAAHLLAFAETHALPISMHMVTPNVSNYYLNQILSGRTAVVFPKQNATCSKDMKEGVITKKLNVIAKETGLTFCSVIGVRDDESAKRQQSIAKHGLNNLSVTKSIKNGATTYTMAPIKNFNEDEIFGIITDSLMFKFGLSSYECPIDADLVMQQYQLGAENTCSMAVMKDSGVETQACGTVSGRFGCTICTRIKRDTKHEQIAKVEGYEWLQTILNVREFMAASEYKLDNRNWLGRSIKDGQIKLESAAMSSEFVEKLLKFILTAQEETPVTFLKYDDLLFISIAWGRYGMAHPSKVFAIWNDIVVEGNRYYPTAEDMTPAKKVSIPKGQMVKVLDDQDEFYGDLYNSVKSIRMEMADPTLEVSFSGNENHIPSSAELEDWFWFMSADYARRSATHPRNEALLTLLMETGAQVTRHDTNNMMQLSALLERKGVLAHMNDQRFILDSLLPADDFSLELMAAS